MWEQRYNGTANSDDRAYKVMSDYNDNIIVFGTVTNNLSGRDFATLVYTAAGAFGFLRQYNGPLNEDDWAVTASIDSFDDFSVTGHTYTKANASECVTIKYNLFGEVIWSKTSNLPHDDYPYAITTDINANAYITGSTSTKTLGTADILTIKYSWPGIQEWRRIVGSVNGSDYGTAIAADNNNNVYVAGTTYEGKLFKWNIATIKYGPIGEVHWIKYYDGANKIDEAVAVKLDSYNNVFVTGKSEGTGTGNDIVTIKYDVNGNFHWAKRFDGTAHLNDVPTETLVDGTGNIYVTGWCTNTNTGKDCITIKYNTNGTEMWRKTYSSQSNLDSYQMRLLLIMTKYISPENAEAQGCMDQATMLQ